MKTKIQLLSFKHAMSIVLLAIFSIGLHAEDGHFEEIDGLVSVEAEDTWENSSKIIVSETSVGGTAAPRSNKGLYVPCEGRHDSWAKWKVTFHDTGKYKIYWLGVGGGDLGSNNLSFFLGKAPETLRSMSGEQNCTYLGNDDEGCCDFEMNVTYQEDIAWLGRGDGEGNDGFYQCISSRGCEDHDDIGLWHITEPGTWYFGFHTGNEPYDADLDDCESPKDPSILLDKWVFKKEGSKPSGEGPPATYYKVLNANFSYSGVGKAPAEVNFDASGTIVPDGVSVESYTWDFGDGNTGSGETISHTFTENKDYTVQLTVNGSNGDVDSTSQVIKIIDPANFALRINAAGPEVYGYKADQEWKSYSSETSYGYSGGDVSTSMVGEDVSGTDADSMYTFVRHKDFEYYVNVPAEHNYNVTLHFVEYWRNAGERVFKMDIEGDTTQQIDVVDEVGTGKAYTITKTVHVTDGILNINSVRLYDNNDGNPMVSGIEVTGFSDTIHTTGVSLNKTSITLDSGNSETLDATVSPSDATDKTVTWSSDNDNIVSVDANGKVEALKEGTATITVTTNDGGYTATCDVTVDKGTSKNIVAGDQNDIKVWNTDEMLHIVNGNYGEVSIINLNGIKLLKTQITNSHFKHPLNDISNGVYLIKIVKEKEVYIHKMIKSMEK